jgi:hypothetical protein
MTVAFRASATDTNTNGVDETTVVITKPTGTVDNDLMVAVVEGYLPVTLTAPTGWLLVAGPVADSTGLYSWCYQKVASSEGASYTWTWSGAGGALNGSITSFSGASRIDRWAYAVTSTTDPSVGTDLAPENTAMRYAVYCWRDTTANTCTWTIGTEAFDVQAKDVGTIVRGQSGSYSNTNNDPGVSITADTCNPTNSVTHGIHWSFTIGASATTAESWASSGFAVEIDLDGTWTDITSYIRAESAIQITRGRQGEGSQADYSRALFTVENTDGRFSPRNPMGAWYGTIGRNTACRIAKAHGAVALQLQGEAGDRCHAVATESLNIASDVDIRIDCQAESWRQAQILAGKVDPESPLGGNAWVWYLNESGYMVLEWQNAGAGGFTNSATSTEPVPQGVRQALRVTLDVNNGASGNTATFYTSDTIAGSWTQLGSAVTASGTTAIGPTGEDSAPITVGGLNPNGTDLGYLPGGLFGLVYHFELLDGIAGSKVADVDFTAQTTGVYTFTEQSNVWLCFGNAVISNRRWRFHGELSELPVRWDSTGSDVWVEIEASGLTRRMEQRATPVRSAQYRFHTSTHTNEDGLGDGNTQDVEAYWPMEDGERATRFSSGLPGGSPMLVSGSPEFASYEGFKSSSPLPNWKTGSSGRGATPGTTDGNCYVSFLLSAPSGITNGATILNIATTGTLRRLELTYPSTDNLNLRGFDSDGVQLFTSLSFGVPIAGDLNCITIHAYNTGSDVAWAVYSQELTATTATLEMSGTLAANTLGRVAAVNVNNGTTDMNDVYLGHLAVYGPALHQGVATNAVHNNSALNAYLGEDATSRAYRLCSEESIEVRRIGDRRIQQDGSETFAGDGEEMGYQEQDTILALLRECEESDGGFLYEPREIRGLGYRSRSSLYNTDTLLELNYSSAHLAGELNPVDDDGFIRNRVTVERKDGSASTYEKESGPLSTAAAPDGVGVYDESVTLSLEADDQTDSQASWRVHLGTVDEARYPIVELELFRSQMTSSIIESALTADVGDRITISNIPSWMAPETITLQVVGYAEVFDKFTHSIKYNCDSESPYQVAETWSTATDGTTSFRAGSAETTLNEDLDTTETDVDVAIASGSAIWSTTADDFDIMIGGERMTVTSLSGASSPQTFTVTRSVNGVVKSHSSGAQVKLFKPAITAL